METQRICYRESHNSSFKSYYVVWKLVCKMEKNSRQSGLNRTMQYGNLPIWGQHKNTTSCLNRTMQYGNAHRRIRKPRRNHLFKSYYVVWKPILTRYLTTDLGGLNRTMQYGNVSLCFEVFPPIWFKSYYVVWKLIKCFIFSEKTQQFKSYYVVWKQQRPNTK